MPEELMKLLTSKEELGLFISKLWNYPDQYESSLMRHRNVFWYAPQNNIGPWDIPKYIAALRLQYQNPLLQTEQIFKLIFNDLRYRSYIKLQKAADRFTGIDDFAIRYSKTLTKHDEIVQFGKKYPEFYQDWIRRVTNGSMYIESKYIKQLTYIAKNILPANKISDWLDNCWHTQGLYASEAIDLLEKWFKLNKKKENRKEVDPYTASLKTSYDLERRF